MLSDNWDISYDGLRQAARSISFFGLGFVQIKLSDRDRVHCYHPDLPVISPEPHTHRYDFASTIYRGKLQHCLWKPVPGDTHVIAPVSCSKDAGIPAEETLTGLKRLSWYALATGSIYGMTRQEFHTVENISGAPAVTLLTRAPTRFAFANIIKPAGVPHACPFSSPMSEDDLWKIVKECLR